MLKLSSLIAGVGMVLFASFSSNASYQLKSYSVGPGATNTSSSSTYSLQGSSGEQTNGSTSNSTYTANNGSEQTEQLNVPVAPTLSNGSNAYYNKLNLTINLGNDTASDTTFVIAVQHASSGCSSWSSSQYVQADGTLGSSPLYQTYATWGGSGGSFIVGLSPGTCYQANIAAMQGKFSNTAYGAFSSSATTASPSVTFSVSPGSISMGNLLPGLVITSSNLSFTLATNAYNGGSVYVNGVNPSSGLYSTAQNHTIPAYSGNISSQNEGFGIQSSNLSAGLSSVGNFGGTGHTVGAESTTPQQMLFSTAPITSGTANANLQAISYQQTPPGNDYQETLTFIATASF